MESIPDITLDKGLVRVGIDGRYYMHDFTGFPQWYFKGTYYMPFTQRRPSPENLPTHEYHLAWYNIQPRDFKTESKGVEIGLLGDELIEGFMAMRMSLAAKVTQFIAQETLEEIRYNEMKHSMRGMQFASLALKHAPQDYLMTLLMVTSFQRHFLETLACYTYLSVYLPRRVDTKSHPVDPTLMGTITSDLLVAQEMKDLGVPVWLVRRTDMISRTMNVCMEVAWRGPTAEEALAEVYPGSVVVFKGRPSTIRNRACQALQISNIRIPHSAYAMQPGDDFHGSGPMPGKIAEVLICIENSSNKFCTGIAQRTAVLPSSPSTPSPLPTPSAGPAAKRGISKQDFNHDKFLPSTSPLSPSAIPAWATALTQVSKDFRDVWDYEGHMNLKGYPCLDSFIIAGNSTVKDRANKSILSWLLVSSLFLTCTITSDMDNAVKMPNPHQWREFLMKVGWQIGLDPEKSQEHRNPSRKKTSAGMVENLLENLPTFKGPVDIYWGGVLLRPKSAILEGRIDIDERVVREVVWDAFEHCWCMELLSLDRTILPRKNMTAAACMEREAMVADIFPRGLFIMHQMSMKDEGLGAKEWSE